MRRSVNIRASSTPAVSPVGVAAVGVLGAFSAGTAGALAASPPGGEYTLANALAGVPFAVNPPIAPTITSEQTVTPATLSANLVNGRRVTLQAGTYSGFTINTTDQEFVLLSGVTVTGSIGIGSSARRIIIRGNPLRDNSVAGLAPPTGAPGITDLLVNGITIPGATSMIPGTITRAAFINNYIRVATDSIMLSGSATESDIIWANNYLTSEGSGQTGFRSHGYQRFVFVDNFMRKLNSDHNTFRIHSNPGNARFHCVRRNQFQGGRLRINPIGDGTAWPSALRIEDVWFEDNDFYRTFGTVNSYMEVNHPNDVIRLTYRDNRNYGDTSNYFRHDDPSPRFSDGTAIATWNVSGNSIQPLPGTIPAWSFK
jgi:hypothetical protein